MNAARALLGVYVPGTTPWHRWAPGWKYLVFLAITVPVIVSATVPVVLGGIVASLVLVLTTGAPVRLAWGLPTGLAVLLGAIAVFHVATGHPDLAVRIVGITLTALYASRLILLTTPMPRLIDALVAFVAPLRVVGVDPERFGLAVAVFLRSVPHVVASFGEVRDALRARGITRNPVAAITPVTVAALVYARTTGDALQARGLGDPDRPMEPEA
ncbi:MAG: energy-coupling factor transporter transmembrane component T family protein [Propioniciclava sp.]